MSESAPEKASETALKAAALDAEIGDIDWTALPAGAVRSRFTAPSGGLAVVSLGDPHHPRVVLLPGVTGSKEDFVLMMPALALAGYFVQSLDLAGQYESHNAGSSPYSYELFVDDVVAFLETGTPAHLLGYSFAGIVAQIVALRRPELLRSLTLLTTPPIPGNTFSGIKVLGHLFPLAGPRVSAALMIWGVKQGFNRPPKGRLKFVRARFKLTSRRSVADVFELMMQAPDLSQELREGPVSICVVTSTHDLWPVRRYEQFAEAVGAQLHVYRTGHSPCETTPHQLCADLLEFYDRSDSDR